MKIYRIDGNYCGRNFITGLNYHLTREVAELFLKKNGFYLETRKWEGSVDHSLGSLNSFWYNKELSEFGYTYDSTSYRCIVEITINEE